MWRERPAIAFIRKDDPRRVIEIDRLSENQPSDELVAKVTQWAQTAINLPPVNRLAMTGEVAASFNTPTGWSGGVQLPERKTAHRDWCEIVRLDLYDAQWHCRQCGLESWSYILAQEDPPVRCPRCGYAGEVGESPRG